MWKKKLNKWKKKNTQIRCVFTVCKVEIFAFAGFFFSLYKYVELCGYDFRCKWIWKTLRVSVAICQQRHQSNNVKSTVAHKHITDWGKLKKRNKIRNFKLQNKHTLTDTEMKKKRNVYRWQQIDIISILCYVNISRSPNFNF